MRKFVLLSLNLLLFSIAEAQIHKGDIQLGLALNMSEQGFVSNQINVKRLHTGASYFITDKWSVGGLLGYRNTIRTTFGNSDDNLSDQVFQVGVYARYHLPIAQKFHVFLQPSAIFGTGSTDMSPSSTVDYRTLYAQVSPGITYFFAKKWGIDLSFSGIRYTQVRQEAGRLDDSLDDSDFTMNFNNMSIGLSFYLK